MNTSAPRPSTVQSTSKPRATSTARTLPIGMNGDAAMASRTATMVPTTTAAIAPAPAATLDAPGAAPIARSAAAFLGLGTQLTTEREADEHEAHEERDGTEQRERDGERSHRLLGVEGGDRGDAEELRTARVEEAHVALLERVDVGVAALQHEPLPLVLHVGERLAGVGGRQEDQCRAIGVVLHHFLGEQPDADDGRGHAQLRRRRVLEEVLG